MYRKETVKIAIHLWTFFLSSLLAFAPQSFAASAFKITAPQIWKLTTQTQDGTITYINSKSSHAETVLIQVLPVQSENDSFQDSLVDHKKELTGVRALLFSQFNLAGYTVMDIANKKSDVSGAKTMQVIESRFRNLADKETQMVERQYLSGKKLYVITYLVESGPITDRVHVDNILNNFRPIIAHDRAPASFDSPEVMNSGVATSAKSEEHPDRPQYISEMDPDSEAFAVACKDTKKEDRLTKSDGSFSHELATDAKVLWSCVKGGTIGLVDLVKGMVTGAAKLLWAGVKFYNPFSHEYSDQVFASVDAVANQVSKDPNDFFQQVGAALYNKAVKVNTSIQCMKPELVMEKFCGILSNLIPLGLIGDVLSKAPLAADKAEKLAALMKDAFDTKQLKIAGKPASDAKLVETTADGTRKYIDPESGIEVTVKDGYGGLSRIPAPERAEAEKLIAQLEAKGVAKDKIKAAIEETTGPDAKCGIR